MYRQASIVAALVFCVSCGDPETTPNSSDPDAGDSSADAGPNASTADGMKPVRTRESALVYWPMRPDLAQNMVSDLGAEDNGFGLGENLYWFDDVDNGVYIGSGAQIAAEVEGIQDAFSVDFWWKPAADRNDVTVLRLGDPAEPNMTLRLREMRTWVLEVPGSQDTPQTLEFSTADRPVTDPIHFTVTLDRHGTLRVFHFGVLETGIVLREPLSLAANVPVTFGDDADDAPDGTLHTAAIYSRKLTPAEIWDHYRVGPFPTEADEVATSPDRWIAFASRRHPTVAGPSFEFAYLDQDEPDRLYENVDEYDFDRGETTLLRWLPELLPVPGEIGRVDLRAWASRFSPSTPRSLEVAFANRAWDPAAATWNSAGEEPWETPGALARPGDRSVERFEAAVNGVGPIHLPVPQASIDAWLADPDRNMGFVLRPYTDNEVVLCHYRCGPSSQFIAAALGGRSADDGEPTAAPDVSFEALGDGGIRVVAETDFCGDPDDGLSPCIVEVFARGSYLGQSYLGGVDDAEWRPERGDTFRVYVLDENLRPSLPFDGAPE